MDKTNMQQVEWQTLQQAYDKYEFGSLAIKLIAITLTLIGYVAEMQVCILASLIAILWLQDGIWKTFQSRFETRLLEIEQQSVDCKSTSPAFNVHWQKQRPSVSGLIKSYICNALKPTVMYPYIGLIGILLLSYIFGA